MSMSSNNWIVFFIIYVFKASQVVNEDPRTLVLANGGIIKLIVGVTMPVELPISLVWLQNLQFQYPMIDNASQLTYLNLDRKASRKITRNMAYKMLSNTWDRFGMNGTACILKLICVTAKYSFSHNGILGQLLHTVFKPHQSSNKIYLDAKNVGKDGCKCSQVYSGCKSGVYDYFIKDFKKIKQKMI